METERSRTIGRVAVQYGLHWKLIAQQDDILPRIWARQEARKANARFGLLKPREDGAWRLGLLVGARVRGPLYSGAQWLAERATGPTLAIEYLGNDNWWVFRAEPGDVITDEVVPHSRAAEKIEEESQTLWELTAIGDDATQSPVVYIVGERQIDTMSLSRLARHVQRITAAEIFAGDPPEQARLDQLVGLRPRTIIAMASGVVLLGLAYAGNVVWEIKKEEARQEAERLAAIAQEAEAARLRTLAQVRAVQAVRKALAEDTATPQVAALVANCISTVAAVGSTYAGWRVERADCEPNGDVATVGLRLATGQPGFEPSAPLMQAAALRGHEVAIDLASDTASVRIPMQPPAARPAMERAALPRVPQLQAGLVSRLQLLQHVHLGTAASFTAPGERSVRFVNPQYDNAPDHPERWMQVPPEAGYTAGSIRVTGQGLTVLASLRIVEPFVTMQKLSLQPSGMGDWNWEMEARYVSAAL